MVRKNGIKEYGPLFAAFFVMLGLDPGIHDGKPRESANRPERYFHTLSGGADLSARAFRRFRGCGSGTDTVDNILCNFPDLLGDAHGLAERHLQTDN